MGRPELFLIDVIILFNQYRTQSHYLCIHIVRRCNKALLHQHVKICSVQQSSCPHPPFPPHSVLLTCTKFADAYLRWDLLFSSIRATNMYERLSCSASSAACRPSRCPPHSINNSSLDINIIIPHGTKMSFFRTKGEYTRWETGDLGGKKGRHWNILPLCLVMNLLAFPVLLVNGQQNVPCADTTLDRTKQHVHRDNFLPHATAVTWSNLRRKTRVWLTPNALIGFLLLPRIFL